MGLFGGFRAKFSKDSNKKTDKNEVVCLGYRVYSEFDNVQYTPPTATVKKSQPQPPTRQQIPKKDLETENRPQSLNGQKPPSVAKKTKSETDIGPTNTTTEKQTKSILKAGKYKDDHIETITTAKEQINNGHATVKNDYVSVSNVDANNSTQILITSTKTSETRVTEEEDVYYNQQMTTFGYTTSQAANIFFGDDEPQVVRPRRIELSELNDEENRRSSGADC